MVEPCRGLACESTDVGAQIGHTLEQESHASGARVVEFDQCGKSSLCVVAWRGLACGSTTHGKVVGWKGNKSIMGRSSTTIESLGTLREYEPLMPEGLDVTNGVPKSRGSKQYTGSTATPSLLAAARASLSCTRRSLRNHTMTTRRSPDPLPGALHHHMH